MYYEFQNKAKISHIDRVLVAYIDLSTYNSKYVVLKELYDSTASVCSQLTKQYINTDILQLGTDQ